MNLACILGGASLIACGVALSRLRPPDWRNEGLASDANQQALGWWARVQRVIRLMNNCLISIIGGAIIGSALIPRGQAWIALWCVVLVLLLVCILLAVIDAFSSFAGYRHALPEAARRSLSVDPEIR